MLTELSIGSFLKEQRAEDDRLNLEANQARTLAEESSLAAEVAEAERSGAARDGDDGGFGAARGPQTAAGVNVEKWEELGGNYVLRPPDGVPVRALVHFLGGAFVGAAPHVTYRS